MYIFWNGERTKDSWKDYFSQNYIFCDAEFVQLTSIVANRRIVIYLKMDNENRDQIIDPHMDCECGIESPNEPPLYLLHYDDVHFRNPHYQSIRPKPNNNIKLPMRDNNLQRNANPTSSSDTTPVLPRDRRFTSIPDITITSPILESNTLEQGPRIPDITITSPPVFKSHSIEKTSDDTSKSRNTSKSKVSII